MAAASKAQPVAKATPATPRPAPAPKRTVAVSRRSRRVPLGALKVGLLALGAALLGGAARYAEPVRRAHRRSQPLAGAKTGFVRASGIGRPVVGVVASTVGKVPGLYIRERTWRFTGSNWRLERDEADGVSFLLDDGTAVAVVAADGASFFPFRVARFYNEVPVERWYDRAYPSDTRTEVHYLPAEAPVTVLGRYLSDDATFEASSAWGNVSIVEGDPRRIVRGAAILALGLGVASLAAFAAAIVLSPR